MALPAQDGALLFLEVAPPAPEMISIHQTGYGAISSFSMTIGTHLVFRGLPFYQLAILIKNMMAHAAIIQTSLFVMAVMGKNSRRSLGVLEFRVIHDLHVLLAVSRR